MPRAITSEPEMNSEKACSKIWRIPWVSPDLLTLVMNRTDLSMINATAKGCQCIGKPMIHSRNMFDLGDTTVSFNSLAKLQSVWNKYCFHANWFELCKDRGLLSSISLLRAAYNLSVGARGFKVGFWWVEEVLVDLKVAFRCLRASALASFDGS